jgi:acetylornithine deacetylase/succinyl-diaminopimelate desuccinylase-like protein
MIRPDVLKWLKDNDYRDELIKYISIPSRSSEKEEVKLVRDVAIDLLKSCGLDTQHYETEGNDVIVGKSLVGIDKPTILIYGHYDVQPEGSLELWDSPPFEAEIRGGKLYGRGSADNKGQHYAHILSLRYLREMHPDVFEKLNIKFILDGDEELGSFSLPGFVEKYKEEIDADFVYVSDGPSLSLTTPTIVGSVRGIIGFQIEINYNNSDLHSGNFGGIARSSTTDLISLLSDMVDINGQSKIPGFYDDIIEPSDQEIDALKKLDGHYDTIIEINGITSARSIEGRSVIEQNQMYSTFNINGISGGSVGNESRTIVPRKATASIDCRLIPNQNPDKVSSLIEEFVYNWAKDNDIARSNIKFNFEHAMWPIQSSMNSEYFNQVADAVKIGFDKDPILVPRLGGSLPLYLFDKYLKKPVILVPYALPDERNHAPNENLDIDFFESGVASTVVLLLKLAKII